MRLIDADELKTAFPSGETVRTECVRATIDHMLTIKPERKKGKWLDLWDRYRCSVCNMEHSFEENFCPNCGADMRD